MSRKKLESQKIPCVYCDNRISVTMDHVIPRGLFVPPLPKMVTVPACHECNLEKSKDEEYLREMLVIDHYASKHPVAQNIFNTKVLNAVKNRKAKIAYDALKHGKKIALVTPQGFWLEDLTAHDLDQDRVDRIFRRIIQGFYYHFNKKTLPGDLDYRVTRLTDQSKIKIVFDQLTELGAKNLYDIGNGIVDFKWLYVLEEPRITTWLISFYDSITFFVLSRPRDMLLEEE